MNKDFDVDKFTKEVVAKCKEIMLKPIDYDGVETFDKSIPTFVEIAAEASAIAIAKYHQEHNC